MDGVVSVKDNLNTNFGYQGMTLNEHRVGDQVQAGAPIAEVLDLGQLEIGADIDENDRARLAVGQSATLTLDALGGRAVRGEGQLGRQHHAAALLRPGAAGPSRMFSATLALDRPGRPICGRGSPGASRSAGAPQVGVLHVPRGAVFERDGGTVVFVRGGGGDVGGFTPTPVKVLGKTESSAVVEGVAEGTAIALADPSRRGAASVARRRPPDRRCRRPRRGGRR